MSVPHRLSASKRRLGRLCLFWARGDVEIPANVAGAAANLGNGVHEAADEDVSEDVFRDGWAPGADLDAIAEKWGLKPAAAEQLVTLHAVWSEWWPTYAGDLAWRTEVPYAFDTATGQARELPSAHNRDYSKLTATEVPGTVDAVHVGADFAIVVDLKTGQPPKRVVDHLEQLAAGALCVARLHPNVERVRVVIAHITPRGVFPDELELDVFDLDATAAELRRELAAIPGAPPRPGMHCSKLYCAAQAVCPETQRGLAIAAPEPLHGLPLAGPVESDAQAEILLEGLPRFEAWIEERRRAVKAYADTREGGVRLSGGLVYVKREKTREIPKLEVKGAVEALRSVLGAQTEEAIDMKTSKAAITRAARKLAVKRGDLGRLTEAAEQALRKIGAMKVSTYEAYEVREAQLPAAAAE